MDRVIEVDNVSFAYDTRHSRQGRPLLDRLSFHIHQSEVVGIIGPNGCGKSTLINLVSKVLIPQSGKMSLMGRSLAEMKQAEIARLVAVLPQDISASFHYTVEEMVLMGRAPHRQGWGWETDDDYRLVEEALECTETKAFSGRWFLELSGGEKCRVLLARALAQTPRIFLLDEPTANLDLRFQTRVLTMMVTLARGRGATLVMVTHDLNLVAEYCDRVLVLKDGRIYREGSPKAVIQADTIHEVYGAEVHIGTNPHSGAPHVFLKTKVQGESEHL